MPPRKQPGDAPPDHPAFYVATRDLFTGDPESGAMPVAVFRAGDRIPPALVVANQWGNAVEPALDSAVPDPPPEPEPEHAPANDKAAPPAADSDKAAPTPAGENRKE